MAQRRVELQFPPEVAWQQLRAAFSQIGTVEEATDSTRTLVGKARYGLNPVRLRVSVLASASPDATVLDIQGRGQDVWGVASRKVIDRLIAALDAMSAGTVGAMSGSLAETDAKAAMYRECPHCKETMRRDASVCPHCRMGSDAWTLNDGFWWAKDPADTWRYFDEKTQTWKAEGVVPSA